MNTKIGTKSNPLRVLVLNSLQCAENDIVEAIRHTGYTVKSASAKNNQAAKTALQKFQWDLLIYPAKNAVPDTIKTLAAHVWKKSSTPLLLIEDTESSTETSRPLLPGARDVINLNNAEWLKHIIRREMHDLAARRALRIFEQNKQGINAATSPSGDENSQSNLDDLTQLYTRQYFMAEFTQILNKLTESKRQYALLHIQPDNFFNIRQEAGLSSSNNVLIDFTKIIRNTLGQLSPITRFDEKTFIALVEFSSQQELSTLSEKIRRKISKHSFSALANIEPFLTCSIGVSLVLPDAQSAHHQLHKAQTACSIAQQAGGNNIHVFNPESDTSNLTAEDRNWESSIRHALKNNRFKLAFQPIVNMKSKQHNNYEALIRMVDRDDKEILPGKFILAAEQSGLISEIDQWVIKNVFDQLNEKFGNDQQSNMFIKLSHASIINSNFLPWLDVLLRGNKIQNSSLTFEINTVELSHHPIELHNFITKLNKLGCRSALEYFGTQKGISNSISGLAVDFLKIDRSLTHNLPEHPDNEATIKSIIANAHTSNKYVIAEFVEDARTMSILWSAGIDYMQGYFLQQPDNKMGFDFSESAI